MESTNKSLTGMSFSQRGFTIIELMIVVVILGILIAVAGPGLQDFLTVTRLETASDALVSDILFVRSEASNRGVPVVMCPGAPGAASCGTSADWAKGRLVYPDLNRSGAKDATEAWIVRQENGVLSTDMTLTLSFSNGQGADSIAFSPAGGLNPPGISATYKLCSTYATRGRQILVTQSGRPAISSVACP
jgi:type IV fimbrial biogenesis protein FimT